MPSFRDLKGRPVEEVTVSRPRGGSPPAPPEDTGRVVLPQAAKDAIRRISERPREQRSGSNPSPETAKPLEFSPPGQATPERVAVPLPDDFEAGLRALEGSLAIIVEQARSLVDAVNLAQGQMTALRQRAEQDAGRLAKLNAALKTLTE